MVWRLSRRLTLRRSGLALIPALAAVAGLAAPAASASAASPLTGETLAGTATTTSGGGRAIPNCTSHGLAGVGATFNASGEATGPYPGSFVENQGSASLSESVMHNQLSGDSLTVPFTITSGATTITGTISHSQSSRYPNLNGFGFLCNGPTVVGLSVNTAAAYTATIQAPGKTPQAISGQAQVVGDLHTEPGAQGSLTAIFTG